MKQTIPKCTIAIPVYNREGDIRRALDSALDQDLSDLEVIVVDNHSTDATWEVVQAYADPRLRMFRNDVNVGLFGNFNRCLEVAGGIYLRFLCSDDVLLPNCIRAEVELMEKHPDVVLLSSRARCVDANGRLVGTFAAQFQAGIYEGGEAIAAALWFIVHYGQNPVNYPSGILLRRAAALQAGQFPLDMELAGDLDYFFRILRFGGFAVRDQFSCELTIHRGQAGFALGSGGAALREVPALVESQFDLLQGKALYHQVRSQIPGWATWQLMKMLSMGFLPSREFWHEWRALIGHGWLKAAFGVFCLVRYRLRARLTTRYMMPPQLGAFG